MIRSFTTNLKVPPFSFPLNSSVMKTLIGVSGVYMIINTKDPSKFYIGSSVNLGRRIQEYLDIVLGQRASKTSFENILSTSETGDWAVIIIAFVQPSLVLVEEQLAICTFYPSLNVNYSVLVNYWLPNFDLTAAISLATEYQNMFEKGSENYIRFSRLILVYTNALSAKLQSDTTSMTGFNFGMPVFVYDWQTGGILSLFSSTNTAVNTLHVSQDTISNSIRDLVVYTTQSGQQIVFSYSALTPEEVKGYLLKANITQTQFGVVLTNSLGVVVHEFNSLR